jgi:predicted nucleic acid-binding protein
MVYFDTTSFVKLYVDEEGSSSVRDLMASPDVAASSWLLFVEMHGVLARMSRSIRIDASYREVALARFESDWSRAVRIPLTESILRAAAAAADRHVLPSLDAIHLASALTLSRGGEVVLSSWDSPLLDAAAAEGIRVAGP